MSAISIKDLQHAEGGRVVLNIPRLEISEGNIVAVLGPTGCGKTTLLHLLAGLREIQGSGSLTVAGTSAGAASRAGGISYSFQTPVLMPWRTVSENVELPRELRAMANDARRTAAALALVRLTEKADAFPNTLSSGMRSRVAVAQAIVAGGPILLMDEVFGTLDEATRVSMDLMLRQINATTIGATIVFVTHNIDEALLVADRILLFQALSPRHGQVSIVSDDPVILGPRSLDSRYTKTFIEHKKRLESLFFEELRHVG
jgi:NitT/TauT family transport system ATP-binding protein